MNWPIEQQQLWLKAVVEAAREQPGGQLDIRDESGAVVATLHVHATARRPKDMPRALRPKQKLSKRQRTQAKLDKLVPPGQRRARDPLGHRLV